MPLKRFNENALRRRDPFRGFFDENFFTGEIERGPAANIMTAKDRYEIHLALPGYKKESIHVSVEQNVLTVSAEEVSESEITDDYNRREFYQSSFERSFSLPDDVNENKISARFEDGVLKLSIGRHDHDPRVRSRQIEIS